jgi:Carboxypeptidase regulatory-like domain
MAFCSLALFSGLALEAQSTSGGGIQGTISDPDGRAVAKAIVTATNTDTGVQTTAVSGNGGTYTIQPLQAGPYNVEVVAKGFERLLQENVTVDNASVLGLPLKLKIGSESTTVTVTDAPAMLDTTDATLGGTIENELYSSLPLSMNGGPRDPTAFQYLMPGVQENPANNTGTGANNGNSGIYGGSGATNLNENYLEGMSVTNVSQQGSSNPISSAVSVDAVDQFSVATSGASASFGGAGSTNYTIKSGGNQFHGTVFDFIRNTDFDTWGYFSKVANSAGVATKPGEHQNSYGGSVGGPIIKDRLFFFGSYEGYHFTNDSNTPNYITVPTMQQRTGNFTDVLGSVQANLFNPSFPSDAFTGLLNGVPTYNVIKPQYISSISNYLQSALPQPTNLATFQNYLARLPQENSDYSIDARIDYTINQRNKFSVVGVGGNIGYGGQPFYSTQTQLPRPYAAGQFTNQKTASGVISYVYIASQSLINSLKYLYSRNWGQGFSLTANQVNPLFGTPLNTGCPPGNESACAAGINNLPPGGASANMPAVSFSQSNGPVAPQNWSSTSSSGPRATNTYAVQDELQWIKGRHNIKFGALVEWLQTNGAAFGGYSQSISLNYNAYDTEVGTVNTGTSGDAYASFLIGAVYSGGVTAQSITTVGGRFRQPAAYVQDNWQATPKLTLNLGFRYDYLQPYHEVKNRISFLNSAIINPVAGVPGVLMYAGFPDPANYPAIPANPATGVPAQSAEQVYANYAPYTCHCTTPVHPYNKNLEPRIGFSYAYTPSTVFSGAFSINLTRAGGAGGGSSATGGTGNSGEFSASTTTGQTGSSNSYTPGFYLNPGLSTTPSQTSQNQGTQPPAVNGINGPPIACVANDTCSTLSALPPWTVPGQNVNPLSSIGNYSYQAFFPDTKNDYGCNQSDGINCNSQLVNFADPYYGGRGPQFISYNFSMQKMINKKAVLTIAYSGSQTHFLPGGSGRGYAQNTISPDFSQEYKNNLTASCGNISGCTSPYKPVGGNPNTATFTGAGATLAQSLKPFPQFSSCATGDMAKSGAGCGSDLWGETGNAAYNSLQISVIQRPWHNLSGLINYTRAKELDDTGYHRSQFPIGPQDGNFTRTYTANQIDRGLGTSNQTNAFNVTWVYSFPIGRGQAFFATNRIASMIGGGWQLSGIYKYRDGYPLTVTVSGGCNANASAGQGACMPDYTPGFDKRRTRINGRWGRGPGANAASINQIQYINPAAFECPDSDPNNTTATCGATFSPTATWKIGNLARSAPNGLHGPGWWDVDLGLRRTFNIRETATLHLTFQFEADVSNATNSTFFNVGSTGWTGPASAPPATISFGTISGQNKSILPRDWQFAGRFRF